ncbi:nucleotidyltransferase domain-containing protein [Candidatus Woesearchaeota archaeon]|nr:nucleotidyltransferase domain-containing protein [Candidatus Woesearchaeota archaeon]
MKRKETLVQKRSHIEILGFLIANLNKKFTQLELANRIGKGKSYKNIRESIKELAEQSIIATEEVGASKLCSLNLNESRTIDCISFIENVKKYELFKKAPVVNEISQRLIGQVKLHTPFFTLLIFGSYAKGTFHEKSDIDALIIAESRHHANISKEIRHLQAVYTKKINAFVTVQKDYENMLLSKEEVNVGKESLKAHVLLYGAELYYQMVKDAYGKR